MSEVAFFAKKNCCFVLMKRLPSAGAAFFGVERWTLSSTFYNELYGRYKVRSDGDPVSIRSAIIIPFGFESRSIV